MTFNDFLLILLSIIIVVLVNLFIRRDRTYLVLLKDVKTNLNFSLVAKALSKRKTYEIVSKYLIQQGLPFIIIDITNTVILDNNSIICLNINIDDHEIS